VASWLLLISLPFAAALVAIRFAPPSQVEIAGQSVRVKPILGQDVSEVKGGALVRPDHGRLPFLGKDVGIDISADWNRLIPSDKQTRRYLIALWDDPSPEIRRIQGAARRYLVIWSLVGFLVGLLASSMVVALVIQRRRRLAGYSATRARLVEAHNKRLRLVVVAVGVATALALDSAGLATVLRHDHHVVTSNPAFDGTTLEGTEVTGLMSEVLPFLAILRPRDTFYDRVAANLTAALSARDDLRANGQRTVFVLAEDLEDVNGMAREIGLAADLTDADFVAFSGDLTFAGLPIESYLIDTIDYYSGDKPVYFAPGLHDTHAIVAAATERGWHVADGQTQEASGISLLLEADPRISQVGTFGVGDDLRDPDVDVNQLVQDTINEACATHPDLVLLHDHELGARVAGSGCVGIAVLDGRSYRYLGPTRAGSGVSVEYTSGSSGGHVSTRPNPGRIQHPATFSIITTTPTAGETSYSLVTVRPDATVEVTPAIDIRVPYQEYLSTGQTKPAG
jgi:hypothetical protein